MEQYRLPPRLGFAWLKANGNKNTQLEDWLEDRGMEQGGLPLWGSFQYALVMNNKHAILATSNSAVQRMDSLRWTMPSTWINTLKTELCIWWFHQSNIIRCCIDYLDRSISKNHSTTSRPPRCPLHQLWTASDSWLFSHAKIKQVFRGRIFSEGEVAEENKGGRGLKELRVHLNKEPTHFQ